MGYDGSNLLYYWPVSAYEHESDRNAFAAQSFFLALSSFDSSAFCVFLDLAQKSINRPHLHSGLLEMQRTRPIPDGSRTITIHDTTLRELQPADPNVSEGIEDGGGDVQNRARQPVLVLSLQGGGNDVRRKRKPGRRVVWKEDVIDNEGCGKKKSKSQPRPQDDLWGY